ncbi:MAG: hypothetical protein EHM31_13475, partial [Candidatus Aminicenantes bacterium]
PDAPGPQAPAASAEGKLRRRARGAEHGPGAHAGHGPGLARGSRSRHRGAPRRPPHPGRGPLPPRPPGRRRSGLTRKGFRHLRHPADLPGHRLRLHPPRPGAREADRRDGFLSRPGLQGKAELALAEEYLASGDHAWNSGMFLWRAGVFAEKLEAFAPELGPAWKALVAALRSGGAARLKAAFALAPALSIDYALMEKAGDVLVADGDFGWSDVGAWSTLLEIWPRDRDGNAVRGECVALDAKGCLVWNPGRLTALVGVRDLIVVEAGDALLVCDASLDQRVKDVVAALKKTPGNRKYI